MQSIIRFFERLARRGTSVDLAVAFALATVMTTFYLEGFRVGVFWSALGLFIEAMSPYSAHIQKLRQRKQILNRYEVNPRPLGI
jgi:hypothetical protein